MKRQKRDRHTAKGDRDDRFAQMTSRDLGEGEGMDAQAGLRPWGVILPGKAPDPAPGQADGAQDGRGVYQG